MNPNIRYDTTQTLNGETRALGRPVTTGRTAHLSVMRIRRWVIGLTATAMAFLAGTPAALATNVPPPGGSSGVPPAMVVNPAAVGGMPGWQIALIAAGSALLASAVTLLAIRVARRAAPAQALHP